MAGSSVRAGALTVGLAGMNSHACVALLDADQGVGVCEQQRVTRARDAGFNRSGLPDEALDLLLQQHGRTRADVGRYAIAEPLTGVALGPEVHGIDHHLAHACAAYLTSPFASAAIVVCDHDAPKLSVWEGRGATVTPIEWPSEGLGFADLYSAVAVVFGFGSDTGDQRLEALARLAPDSRDNRVNDLFHWDGTALRTQSGWQPRLGSWLAGDGVQRDRSLGAILAAAVQNRLADLFLEFLTQVSARTHARQLCLAGSFFYHSSINTHAKRSNLFAEVFVPINPGNPGLAIGSALRANGSQPQLVSLFLGPAYDSTEIKATLDNCKLPYDWQTDDAVIETTIQALRQGRLVAWFDGGMEWGPRALGARSILANPLSPYVLENLNRFLKRREPWRGYAFSVLDSAVHENFDGPEEAPFMECDYRPRDAGLFRHALPVSGAAIRVQSVGSQSTPRSRLLGSGVSCSSSAPSRECRAS